MELAGKHALQNELRGIVHNGPRRKIAEFFHYGVDGLIADGKQLLPQTIPCFQASGDGLVFLEVGNRQARHNGDGTGPLQKRLKRGAEFLVLLISVCVLPAPEVVDFAGEMARIRQKAFFGKKLDRLRLSIKKRLPANQGDTIAERLILPRKQRFKALQSRMQDAEMEKAGIIGAFPLVEAAPIPGGEAFQQGFKNGIAEKGLPGCDGLDLPDKMRRRLPFAELFHALNKALLIRLRGRREKIRLCGRQRSIDGRVEARGIVGERLMQQAENGRLKRQTPRAPGDDAQTPQQLIVPVQGSGNAPHR